MPSMSFLANIALFDEEQDTLFRGIITLVGTNTLLAADRGSLQLVTIWRVEEKLPLDSGGLCSFDR